MAQLNISRFEQLAARIFGVKGAGTLTYIKNSVFGTIPLDTAGPVEFWQPQGINRYSARSTVGATAAEYGGLELRNPPDSNEIWVNEAVWVVEAANREYAIDVDDSNSADFYGSGLIAQSLDTRIQPTARIDVGSAGTDVSANPAGLAFKFRVGLQESTVIGFPAVLIPGSSLFLVKQTLNEAIVQAGFIFHVRQALPGELT